MSNYILGIENTGTLLKLAVFQKTGKKTTLKSLTRISPENLGKWVKENLQNATSIRAHLTVPESQMYLQEVILPPASGKQITNAIKWEISTLSPIPVDEAIFDYKILRKDKEKVRALVMLMNAKVSEDIYSLFEDAGIKLLSIEPSSLALSRFIEINSSLNTLLLTVEDGETNLLVLENGYPVFTTSVSVDIKSDKKNARRLSKDVIDNLAASTKKIVDYWQEKEGKIINQIIMTGDISKKYYGLATAINKFAKIPVIFAKPKNRKISTKNATNSEVSRFYVALGAALRNKDKKESLNFLPSKQKLEIQSQKKEQFIITVLKSVSFAILIALALTSSVYAAQYGRNINLERKIEQTQKFNDNHPVQEYVSEAQSLALTINSVEKLTVSQKNLGERLKKIDELKPSNLKLNSITFTQLENEEFTIEGSGDRQDILEFFDLLVENTDAKSVKMPYSNLESPTDNEFEINIVWK